MKAVLRLLLLAGAAAIGLLLFRSLPRDLVLVYDLGEPVPAEVEVVIRRGDEVLRRALLRPAGVRQVRHPVRLPDGSYRLWIRIDGPGGARTAERVLTVEEDGIIVLPIGR